MFNTFCFAVADTGGYVCCFCQQTVRRLIFHLKKGCFTELHTLEALEKAFKTFSNSKPTQTYENKKRKTNEEDFLKNKRLKQAKADTKQKEKNEELFLQSKRLRQEKTDTKQKKEDEELFLQNQRSRRAKTDTKQKEVDEELFLKNQRSRRAKTDTKQKEVDEELFLQNQRSRRAKTDTKQKEVDEELFLQSKRFRQAKTDTKQKEQNKTNFVLQKKKKNLKNRSKPYTSQQRHRDFISHNMYGPIFICCCCHRTLFKASVVAFTDKVITDINRKASSILNTCIYEDETCEEKNQRNPKTL